MYNSPLYGKDYTVGNISFNNCGHLTVENPDISADRAVVKQGVTIASKPPFRRVTRE